MSLRYNEEGRRIEGNTTCGALKAKLWRGEGADPPICLLVVANFSQSEIYCVCHYITMKRNIESRVRFFRDYMDFCGTEIEIRG